MTLTEKSYQAIFWFCSICLIALRFLHFGESIDGPHAWRQCDSANMIWSFYKNGIDLLHPEVCWMGGHKQLVLEFPGVYGIIAFVYEIFEANHSTARAVLLLFFVGGTVYVYKITAFLLNRIVARLSLLIYLTLPLGLFYSRAIQIDFSAMFFVLAMTYHFIVGYTNKRLIHIAIGSVFSVLAFITKVPYVLPVVLPLAYLVFTTSNWKYIAKTVGFLMVPVVVFILWWQHGLAVNSTAPDWNFIPTYRKFTESSHWYFGNLDQRLSLTNWTIVANRLFSEILGWPGLILVLVAFFFRKEKTMFFGLWLVGSVGYLLIFFNLNLVHNYYQIPFLVPLAVLSSVGLVRLRDFIAAERKNIANAFVLVVLIVTGMRNWSYAEANYYHKQAYLELIGSAIQQNSKENDLVIISFGQMDARCPLLLYRSRRNGWSIPHHDLEPSLIYKLMGEGANQLAMVSQRAPKGQGKIFTDFFPVKRFSLAGRDSLFLYQLDVNYLPPKPE